MNNTFKCKTLNNNINIYTYPTTKFKTTTFCLFIHKDLSKQTATKTALLPFILKRGNKNFPTSREFNLYLDDLYGTSIGGDILKRGETQILQFFMEIINSKYVKEDIMKKGLIAFRDVILDPLIENEGFKVEYVNQEKDILKRNIESLYNDKFNYAVERCFREMCKNEAFSIYKYGNVEDLDFIDSKGLYGYYKECLSHCPINFFALGDINEEEIENIVEEIFYIKRKAVKQVKTGFASKFIEKPNYVEEKQCISQGKLTMGFRTNTRYCDRDYYALMVYNGILGGGPHSKLFQNVREKASLAYYAFSRLEKNKGLMLIGSGIEFGDKNKVLDIINKQLDDIRHGKISDYEFDSTIKSLINFYKGSVDSPSMIISIFLDGIINGAQRSAAEIIENLCKVTKNDVINVAQKISLDTIFFLNKK